MRMKTAVITFALCLSVAACAEPVKEETAPVSMLQGPVETFMQGCKTELDSYCKTVTPGNSRLLACIYAHEDHLSSRCEYALYDASSQLERAVAALSYVAGECDDDLAKFCADVQPGGGRLLACLDKQGNQVSPRCRQALEDVQLRKKIE